MNRTALSTYRNRLLLLVALSIVLIGLFWKKKLGPTFHTWQQQQKGQADTIPLAQLEGERARLLMKSTVLDQQFGSDSASRIGWQPVLDLLADHGAGSGVALAGVAVEHALEQEGLLVRTLPLSLQGRTADLVNMIDAVEHGTSGVHLLAVEMQAKENTYNGPRRLTATLYLQTISR